MLAGWRQGSESSQRGRNESMRLSLHRFVGEPGRATRFLIALSLLVCACPAGAASPPPLKDPYLDRLVGSWVVDGTMQDRKIHQVARAEWVMRHHWVLLHLSDDPSSAHPSGYEAAVYIGYAASSRTYVAHWLDVYGGGGATAVGLGKRAGDDVVFAFNYPGGLFRTTFHYDRKHDRWRVHYAARSPKGLWETFGDEELRRSSSPLPAGG